MLSHHAFVKRFVLVAETSTSPSAANVGCMRQRLVEVFSLGAHTQHIRVPAHMSKTVGDDGRVQRNAKYCP